MKNRVAYFGVFTALALIFSYVETLIPFNFGIPGVKLGLANLIIVIALYKMRLSDVYLLSIVRVLLNGFIFGNYFSIIYRRNAGPKRAFFVLNPFPPLSGLVMCRISLWRVLLCNKTVFKNRIM